MNDAALALQIEEAALKAGIRFRDTEFFKKIPERHRPEAEKEAINSFLSGAMQFANFMSRMDGDINSRQLERALSITGKKFGFECAPG